MTQHRKDLGPVQGQLYERLLLEGMATDIKEIRKEQVRQGKDIAGLKIKSSIWGALGGSIVAGLYVLQAWIRGTFRG